MPEHVWWCTWGCGKEVASPDRPKVCPNCGAEKVMDELGYRVGYNGPTYAYYSTWESAMRDKRVG